MRKCVILVSVALGAVFLPQQSAAQNGLSFFIGGGLTVPISDYGEYAKSGYMGMVGFTKSVTESSLWYGLEGLYGHNGHEGDLGDATNLFGANAILGYDLGNEERVHPYVYGSGGFLVHRYSPGDSGFESESETKFAFGGGAGLSIPMSFGSIWIEAKFLSAGDTRLIPFLIGVNLGN